MSRDIQNYKKISKFWKNENLYDYKHVIVPINIDNIHWIMVDVNLLKKKIFFYDSYKYSSLKNFVFKNLIKIFSEYINLKEYEFDKWVYINCDCPKQNNYYDCGVFMCMFIDYISKDRKFDFTQDDIEFFRLLIGIGFLD